MTDDMLVWTLVTGSRWTALRLGDGRHRRYIVCACVIQLLINTVQCYFMAMLSEGQVYVLNAGDSAFLDCTFHADSYNLFDYPVMWRKKQRNEETQVNIMSNINEPFVNDGGRFEVVFVSPASSRYQLRLSILDVSQEDSGNYTCEVRGPQSLLLGYVTHYLFVRARVDRVVVIDSNFSAMTSHFLRAVENQPRSLRCIAFGGYPPPSLDVYIGRRDVTDEFRFTHSAAMSGLRGLRTINYRTERRTYALTVRADDDQANLKCVATVPGLRPYIQTVHLNVDYAPNISCYSSMALIGNKNVFLSCEIRAKPRLTALFWIIDENGTALAEGEVINGHWTLMMDRSPHIIEAQLFTRQARPESFRKYTVVAENNVAIATRDVELIRKYRTAVEAAADATAAGHTVSRVLSRGVKEHTERSSSTSSGYQSSPSVVLHLHHLYIITNCFRLVVSYVCT